MVVSLRKLLAVIGIFVAAILVMRPFGTQGMTVGGIAATSISLVIVFAQRKHFVHIRRTAWSTAIGAFFGIFFLSPAILTRLYMYDHGSGEGVRSDILGGVGGAIVGAIASVLYSLRKPHSRKSKQ